VVVVVQVMATGRVGLVEPEASVAALGAEAAERLAGIVEMQALGEA